MNNSDKIILDLCGGTGAWSEPYRDAGYDVRIITAPEWDVEAFVPWVYTRDDSKKVYGILAAPPCTQFSLARTTAKTKRDLAKGMEPVRACMNIIWEYLDMFCETSYLRFWALENPKGLLRKFLGKPRYTFQPCDFGDSWTKNTDLWGFFNDPKKKPVKLTEDQLHRTKINNRVLPELPDNFNLPDNTSKLAARRAITPPGFAKAFFEANP